jgi:hypothetical protein
VCVQGNVIFGRKKLGRIELGQKIKWVKWLKGLKNPNLPKNILIKIQSLAIVVSRNVHFKNKKSIEIYCNLF